MTRQLACVMILKEDFDTFVRNGVSLPPGYTVHELWRSYETSTLGIVVEGRDLPDSHEGAELPRMWCDKTTNNELVLRSWRHQHD